MDMNTRLASITAPLRKLVDRAFERWIPEETRESLDWSEDAALAHLQQEPIRARNLLHIALIVVFALIVWSGFAEVDEVTRGEGRVIPSSQLQIIQSVDGGVVEEIKVNEGQLVAPGQILLRIDPTRFVANLRENQAEYLALRAKAERLKAQIEDRPFQPSADLLQQVPDIVAQQLAQYASSRAELKSQISIAEDQLKQRKQELSEAEARYSQASQSYELVAREYEVTKPLMESGAVSRVEILRLERDVSRLKGERNQAAAQIRRLKSAIEEASRKVTEVELVARNAHSNELSDTLAKLGSLSESSSALEDRVSKAEVKSPVRGKVKRLLVNTIGGVVQPGTELVEIVPLDDALFLEAKILPKDIAFLRPQQPAIVKFTAYDYAIYGGLDAVVEQIGADTIIDENGNAYYNIRVRTYETELGEDLPIIPGMVAQVDVLTGKKSILSYLLKPVLRARSNALSER